MLSVGSDDGRAIISLVVPGEGEGAAGEGAKEGGSCSVHLSGYYMAEGVMGGEEEGEEGEESEEEGEEGEEVDTDEEDAHLADLPREWQRALIGSSDDEGDEVEFGDSEEEDDEEDEMEGVVLANSSQTGVRIVEITEEKGAGKAAVAGLPSSTEPLVQEPKAAAAATAKGKKGDAQDKTQQGQQEKKGQEQGKGKEQGKGAAAAGAAGAEKRKGEAGAAGGEAAAAAPPGKKSRVAEKKDAKAKQAEQKKKAEEEKKKKQEEERAKKKQTDVEKKKKKQEEEAKKKKQDGEAWAKAKQAASGAAGGESPGAGEGKDGKTRKRVFPGGMEVEELSMGKPDGKLAEPGKKVMMRYIGRLKKTGKVFDSNLTHPQPFAFRLGVGEVIKGWDVGVKGMRIGDKRRLTIPPALGYGFRGAPPKIPTYLGGNQPAALSAAVTNHPLIPSLVFFSPCRYGFRGAPPKIPGNATLEFDVELIGVK
ncbi:unnamed protein product [Closterium sp. Naga37s-1]|nr:unnamed protein product [Closterium sp. Naga37s-1]